MKLYGYGIFKFQLAKDELLITKFAYYSKFFLNFAIQYRN